MVPLGLMNHLPVNTSPSGRWVLLLVRRGLDGVVYFDGGTTLKGAQNSIAACDDLITLFEAAEDFDFGGAGDACGDGDKFGALFTVVGLEHVDTLGELRLGGSAGGGGYGAGS